RRHGCRCGGCGCGRTGLLALGVVALALLLRAAALFGLADALLLVLDAAAVLVFEPLLLAALGLGLLDLGLLRGLQLTLALLGLLGLGARLLFEHITLHVGALHAHFHVHRAGPALGACQLQLALRLALERDLARCGIVARAAAMAAAQV